MLTGQGRGHLPARQSGHFHLSRLLLKLPALPSLPQAPLHESGPAASPDPPFSPLPSSTSRGGPRSPTSQGLDRRQAEAPLPAPIIPVAVESASSSLGKLVLLCPPQTHRHMTSTEPHPGGTHIPHRQSYIYTAQQHTPLPTTSATLTGVTPSLTQHPQ